MNQESAKEKKTGYHVPYWWYDIRGFFIFMLSYQDFLPFTVKFFAKNFSSNHLEAAIGSGSFMDLCLKWRKLTRQSLPKGKAFDYMPSMLKGAHQKFKNNLNWEITCADATQLNYPTNTFETVNIANAFHCINDNQSAAKEFYRVLKPGGTLAVNIVTPPRGNAFKRFIAAKVEKWGIKNNILVSSIPPEVAINIFTNAGFSIEFQILRGNNFCILLKKPKEVYDKIEHTNFKEPRHYNSSNETTIK